MHNWLLNQRLSFREKKEERHFTTGGCEKGRKKRIRTRNKEQGERKGL